MIIIILIYKLFQTNYGSTLSSFISQLAKKQVLNKFLLNVTSTVLHFLTITRLLSSLKFISVRLFPTKSNELPPDEKCTWWIPSAVKVLALLSMVKSIVINYFKAMSISLNTCKYFTVIF